MVAVSYPDLLGAQTPRIEVIPDGDEHPRWNEIREFIARLGVVLDPWQERVLWASLLRRGEQWAAFTVGLCCPRQNGKNAILEMRELVGAAVLGERLIVHSAHLADTSKEAFLRLDYLIEMNEWFDREYVKHVRRQNGHEQIEFVNRSRIRFRTRTRGGGRGFSGSPVVLDEAMYLPEVSMGAILPIASAQPDPQLWYTGSAVDQMIHEDGIAFARVRERAIGGESDRLAYFEWSMEGDNPDDVEGLDDLELIAKANPAFGIRITPEYVRAERGELADRTYAVERGGVGDWPPLDGSADYVIDPVTWANLGDPTSELKDPVYLSFDIPPDRSKATIVAAAFRGDSLTHIEIADQRPGTDWLPERIAELDKRWRPMGISCDGVGPVSSLVPKVQQLGVNVEMLSTTDHGRACGLFVDLVDQGVLRHFPRKELTNAVKGAARRPLGDAWAWSRKNSTVDISPLVAATLATWGLHQGEAAPFRL